MSHSKASGVYAVRAYTYEYILTLTKVAHIRYIHMYERMYVCMWLALTRTLSPQTIERMLAFQICHLSVLRDVNCQVRLSAFSSHTHTLTHTYLLT